MTIEPSSVWFTRGLFSRARLALASTMILAACGQDERRIYEWMTCDECIDSQRPRVAVLRDRAVSDLAVNLLSPPPRRLENARRRIIESYRPVTVLTEQEYEALMLEAFIARTQIRAAVSLGDIGTPRARAELERALREADTRNYRRDVVRAISVALVRATHHPAFTGTLEASEVDFGDTVSVHAGNIEWDGNESVELHGSPFGNEVFLNRFNTPGTDDSLEFVAVGELGTYALLVIGQGTNDVAQVDTLKIRSLRYTVHTTATADVITEAALPQTRYLVLGAGAGSDTIDYLRVEPNSAVSLTATARWTGFAKVHLAWQNCAGGGGGGGFPGGSTVAGSVVGAPGNSLGGAEVLVVGTGLSDTTTPNGAFSIGGIPPVAQPGGLVTLRVRRIGYDSGVFKVPAGTTGHTLTLHPASATPATAMSMTSSVVPIAAGGCRLLQVWTPPGRHQIVQLKVDTATGTSVVVSPGANLLTPGQQAQLAAAVAVTWGSSNAAVATVDGTGNVTAVAPGSAMIRATSVADPSKTDSALVRVYPPAGSNWMFTAPAAEDTVNRDGPGQLAVAVAAHAIGPTGSFQNPFAIVEFWARPTGAGVWRRIGQMSAASAVLTEVPANRFWTYSTTWDPDATTAPFATPSLTRLDLIAIGVGPTGAVSSTPLSTLLWVRVP